jgi:SAM-dependent methyltransferase
LPRDDLYASPLGAAYSAYIERPRVSRVIGRVLWGGDTRPFYESMGAVAAVPTGGTIVDCPCGAGPALRALGPDSSVRYVAADLSPAMLDRARRRAEQRGLGGIEFLEADACDIPVPAASADLFLSYWGLHCFEDPAAAVSEAARVLKPGGRLVGASFLRGSDTLRQRLLIRPGKGPFGQVPTGAELRAWLDDAGLELLRGRASGPMWYFEARLAG